MNENVKNFYLTPSQEIIRTQSRSFNSKKKSSESCYGSFFPFSEIPDINIDPYLNSQRRNILTSTSAHSSSHNSTHNSSRESTRGSRKSSRNHSSAGSDVEDDNFNDKIMDNDEKENEEEIDNSPVSISRYSISNLFDLSIKSEFLPNIKVKIESKNPHETKNLLDVDKYNIDQQKPPPAIILIALDSPKKRLYKEVDYSVIRPKPFNYRDYNGSVFSEPPEDIIKAIEITKAQIKHPELMKQEMTEGSVYCEICQVYLNDPEEAENHRKSEIHIKNLNNYDVDQMMVEINDFCAKIDEKRELKHQLKQQQMNLNLNLNLSPEQTETPEIQTILLSPKSDKRRRKHRSTENSEKMVEIFDEMGQNEAENDKVENEIVRFLSQQNEKLKRELLFKSEKQTNEKTEAEKPRIDFEIQENEKRETEKIERQRAEFEIQANEKREAEKIERQRIEFEREKREAEKIERQRIEFEREKREAERIEREKREAEKIERERAEFEIQANEKREAEKIERQRIEFEREKREAERIEREKIRKMRELEAEKAKKRESQNSFYQNLLLLHARNQNPTQEEEVEDDEKESINDQIEILNQIHAESEEQRENQSKPNETEQIQNEAEAIKYNEINENESHYLNEASFDQQNKSETEFAQQEIQNQTENIIHTIGNDNEMQNEDILIQNETENFYQTQNESQNHQQIHNETEINQENIQNETQFNKEHIQNEEENFYQTQNEEEINHEQIQNETQFHHEQIQNETEINQENIQNETQFNKEHIQNEEENFYQTQNETEINHEQIQNEYKNFYQTQNEEGIHKEHIQNEEENFYQTQNETENNQEQIQNETQFHQEQIQNEAEISHSQIQNEYEIKNQIENEEELAASQKQIQSETELNQNRQIQEDQNEISVNQQQNQPETEIDTRQQNENELLIDEEQDQNLTEIDRLIIQGQKLYEQQLFQAEIEKENQQQENQQYQTYQNESDTVQQNNENSIEIPRPDFDSIFGNQGKEETTTATANVEQQTNSNLSFNQDDNLVMPPHLSYVYRQFHHQDYNRSPQINQEPSTILSSPPRIRHKIDIYSNEGLIQPRINIDSLAQLSPQQQVIQYLRETNAMKEIIKQPSPFNSDSLKSSEVDSLSDMAESELSAPQSELDNIVQYENEINEEGGDEYEDFDENSFNSDYFSTNDPQIYSSSSNYTDENQQNENKKNDNDDEDDDDDNFDKINNFQYNQDPDIDAFFI